ncbi:MAG: homocysteine S-methyltransferase family protein [Owenweeksia sp.]|nr:homocysteine S-methyltransferase family protein [Owenweeksia sp.]
MVKEVHQDFIKAGARIITINSYTATPSRLARDGQPEWFEKLQQRALDIAREARENMGASGEAVQIAGCLPPLSGSYTAEQRSVEELKEEYDRIVALQSPKVDLFIAETISSIREAQAVVAAALESGKPVLLSFTLSDKSRGQLRSGEKIEDAVQQMADSGIAGLMFNCSYPETIAEGISSISSLELPIGGYANAFNSVDPLKTGGTVDQLEAREDLDEEVYTSHAMKWVSQGASLVGGCCEVGPSYIRHLHQRLLDAGYKVTNLKGVVSK